jgi:hypothetical protein
MFDSLDLRMSDGAVAGVLRPPPLRWPRQLTTMIEVGCDSLSAVSTAMTVIVLVSFK